MSQPRGLDRAIGRPASEDAKDKRIRRRYGICWRANLVGMFVVVALSVIKRGRKGIQPVSDDSQRLIARLFIGLQNGDLSSSVGVLQPD